MTDREPWALMTALDELLAREGWQQNAIGRIGAIESMIWRETGVPKRFQPTELGQLHPHFLRSRDAAAMLEEAVSSAILEAEEIPDVEISGMIEWTVTWEHPNFMPGRVYVRMYSEAAARTRAALEAGWRLGLWPLSQPSPLHVST